MDLKSRTTENKSRISNQQIVQQAKRPIGKPCWSPTHSALGTKVHDAFPSFPPTNIKYKIINCWQHTGILSLNDEEASSHRHKTAEPDIKFGVQEATNALQQLNLSVSKQTGI